MIYIYYIFFIYYINFSTLYFLTLKRAISFTKENISFDKNRIKFSFLLLIFIFLIQNLFFSSFFVWFESLKFLQKKSDIVVEVNDDVFDYQVFAFIESLKNRNWIVDVVYSDKNNELKMFWEKHPWVLNFLEKNAIKSPIPWVIEIYSEDIFVTNEIVEFLKLEENSSIINQSQIVLNTELNNRIENLSNFVWFILWIWFLFLVFFAVTLIFIIYSILSLSINHHKDNIKTFEYLWASYNFIKMPYYFEAFYLMFLAFVFSIFIMIALYLVWFLFLDWFSEFLWWFFGNFLGSFMCYIVFVLVFILLSSFVLTHFSVNRYLKSL